MRVPTLTLLLAGGALALGACSATTGPVDMAQAEANPCPRGSELVPTGHNTGDARQDYECRSHRAAFSPFRDTNARNAASYRNVAIDRALSGRSPPR